MRILVTGDRGYIGTIMVPYLLHRGHEAVGLDIDFFSGCDLYDAPRPEYRSLEKDLRDVEAADLRGIDCIAHLAALSNDPMGEMDPALTDEINHQASMRLARLARKAGVGRFLYSSSCSIYGKSGGDFVDETAQQDPLTAYARSKVDTERDLRELADNSFSPVLLRNSTCFGLSPRFRFDLVVNNLAGWAFTTQNIKIMSDGTPWRPLIHIEDVSQAFCLAAEADRELVHNQPFNVGENDQNYQVRAVADIVKRVIGDCQVTYTGEHGADQRTYRVNFDRIHERFRGFRCGWDVERGVREITQKFREVGLGQGDFQGPKFTRLKRLKELVASGKVDAGLRRVG
ncbi:MAG: SDR family oxidoreductase [Euryarchaeota archaeon]|nr:SDR family oxidoreductase [Euryarchaeota archaeon]